MLKQSDNHGFFKSFLNIFNLDLGVIFWLSVFLFLSISCIFQGKLIFNILFSNCILSFFPIIDGVKHEYTNRERYQVYVDFKNGGINYWYVYKELISDYNPYSKELYDKAKLISYSYKKVEYELDGKCDEVDNGELNKKYENTKFIGDINLYCVLLFV